MSMMLQEYPSDDVDCKKRKGLMLIPNQGGKHAYKEHIPINDRRGLPLTGSFQSVIILNLDFSGQFPREVRS